MTVTIKTQWLQTMGQIRAFLEGTHSLGFEAPARKELYDSPANCAAWAICASARLTRASCDVTWSASAASPGRS